VATKRKSARIIEWNMEKGYGFLDNDGSRLFLHIRDFLERDRFPRIGDAVQYAVGYDREGRACAVEAAFEEKMVSREGGFGFGLVFGFLLLLPIAAVLRWAPDLRYAVGYIFGISAITWFAYRHDKNRAQSGGWRIPEIQLHFLELLGGWAAAFLAQHYIRHKTKKSSYKFTFWLIILFHQYLALDSVLGWKLSKYLMTLAH
jgi:uncharacterized membrane protein YsdA (DUF1294 family)/cold shock CspA family protein